MQSAWQLAFEEVESAGDRQKKTLVWKMCQYMGDPCTGLMPWGEDWRHINIWNEVEIQMPLPLQTMQIDATVQNEAAMQTPTMPDYNAAAWRNADLCSADHHGASEARTGADWDALENQFDHFHGDYAQACLAEAEMAAEQYGYGDRFGRTWPEHKAALWDAQCFLKALKENGMEINAEMRRDFRPFAWRPAMHILDARRVLAEAPARDTGDQFAYLAQEEVES